MASDVELAIGCGARGSYHLNYLLEDIGEEAAPCELPKPRLYLDNVEISMESIKPNHVVESCGGSRLSRNPFSKAHYPR